MTDNFRKSSSRRSITLELPHVETPQESLDRLRLEVGELRASRERLVLAADADRRKIERDLHDGPQQQLVALAVNLQLARQLADSDPAAAKALLDEMGRDVQQALDETGKLAHRIYPPLLEAGGLAPALRAAAVSVGVPTRIEVAAGAGYLPEVAGAVYFCCLEVLELAGEGAQVTITVQDEEGAIVFEVVEGGSAATISEGAFDRLRDRVEALGGELTVRSEPGQGTRLSGSLPLSR
jgi:signal transduction histidine kinase